MRRTLSLALTVTALPALALWVHLTVGWRALLAPWATLTGSDVAILLIASAIAYGARALRLYDYFYVSVRHAPWATLRLSLLHNLSNNLLPMRAGEAAFPLLMKRYFGARYMQTGSSLLWIRVLDLAALLLLTAALVLATDTLGPNARGLAMSAVGLGALGVAFLPTGVRALRPRGHGRLAALLRALADGLPTHTSAYWRVVAYTAAAWAGKGLALVWLALHFTSLGPAHAAVGVAAGELSSVLPVHGLAGGGTYEGAMVGALVWLAGAAHDEALRAAVNVHVFLLGTALAFGLLALALPRPAPAGEHEAEDDRVSLPP